ncbi:hypothetical protein D8I35_05400 [Corticibacter populi]|uniref:HNH endonuclease n=2 Tax=Corticibacter populi TaxID=1550736 RepID=A0A3M6R033_9BURK|nr:hypothetical protein D8I35_05400 [Corticibacter populi]
MLADGPKRITDIAGSKSPPTVARARAVVDELMREGAVSVVSIGVSRRFALAGWQEPVEQFVRRTLEDCVPTVDGCMLWSGKNVSDDGYPIGRYLGRSVSLRKLIHEVSAGTPLPGSHFIETTCGNPKCLEPDHLVQVTRSAKLKGHAKPMSQRWKTAMAKRRGSMLDESMVAHIRASDKSLRELSKELGGIPQSTISQVRSGRTWKTYTASPFQGLIDGRKAA